MFVAARSGERTREQPYHSIPGIGPGGRGPFAPVILVRVTKSQVQGRSGSSRRGEETRRRLLRATVELVADHGWNAVTTRQIAERAGAQQALINYHFGSKERLLSDAVELVLREEFASPVASLREAPSFVNGCVALLRQLAALDTADPVVRFSMEAISRAPRDTELQQVMGELLAELRDQLAAGVAAAQERGEVSRRLDPAGTAILLGAVFDGLGLHLLIDRDIDVARAEGAIRSLLTPGREEA
ncbi:MAG TPA: TetR/AcrR family transcriptional regulator [Candidatus Limnocylindria bacterium]